MEDGLQLGSCLGGEKRLVFHLRKKGEGTKLVTFRGLGLVYGR